MASSSSYPGIAKEVIQILEQELNKNIIRFRDFMKIFEDIRQDMLAKENFKEFLNSLPECKQVMLTKIFFSSDDNMDSNTSIEIDLVTDKILELMHNKVDLIRLLKDM